MVEQTLKGNFCTEFKQLDVSRSACSFGFKDEIVVRPDVRVALGTRSLQAAVLVLGEVVAENETQSFFWRLFDDCSVEKKIKISTLNLVNRVWI